jgi:uncharacterized ParB-like nuclease family protein
VRRRQKIALLVTVVILFLAVSAVLARVWSGDGAEQSAVTALVADEARGDAAAMIAAMTGCTGDPTCRARVAADAATLKRAGPVSVLQYQASTGFSLTSTRGAARIAWEVVDKTRPIVQCVRVRRAGNALSGIHIELLEISARLNSSAGCPKRF